MKKNPAPKRKPAPRKAKKPAKRRTITRQVRIQRGDGSALADWSDMVYIYEAGQPDRFLISFCLDEFSKFCDLAGMKPGEVRRFKITTEVIE